jgi:DNA polymerase V
MGLQPKGSVQQTLFDDPVDQAKSDNRMRVMDAINRRWGQGIVTVASSGVKQRWTMRREKKSPSYTTEWGELPVAG